VFQRCEKLIIKISINKKQAVLINLNKYLFNNYFIKGEEQHHVRRIRANGKRVIIVIKRRLLLLDI
jgi:hypothetical protein